MRAYARSARERGLKVIIAGAGGAAHLPGMTAAMTPLPVFGVPIESKALSGLDSLLSIAQMPGGVPVGTLAIGKAGAINAALLAAAVIALEDDAVRAALDAFRAEQTAAVAETPQGPAPGRCLTPALLPPGSTIGVLGTGQLGRMTAMAAAQLGYKCHVFGPEDRPPAAQVAGAFTQAAYEDEDALEAFAQVVNVVTLEFENVPLSAVEFLSARRPVRPAPRPGDRPGPRPGKGVLQRDRRADRALGGSGQRRKPDQRRAAYRRPGDPEKRAAGL